MMFTATCRPIIAITRATPKMISGMNFSVIRLPAHSRKSFPHPDTLTEMDLNIMRRFDYDRSRLPNPILAEAEAGVDTLEHAPARSHYTIRYPCWNPLSSAWFFFLLPPAC